jgi:hypothetical protein
MKDKWFIYADGPDVEGHVLLHFHRSWTGKKHVELAITTAGAAGCWESRNTTITWEASEERIKDLTEAMAKFEALEAMYWVLGVRLTDAIVEPKEWNDLPLDPPPTQQVTAYRPAWVSEEGLDSMRGGAAIELE